LQPGRAGIFEQDTDAATESIGLLVLNKAFVSAEPVGIRCFVVIDENQVFAACLLNRTVTCVGQAQFFFPNNSNRPTCGPLVTASSSGVSSLLALSMITNSHGALAAQAQTNLQRACQTVRVVMGA